MSTLANIIYDIWRYIEYEFRRVGWITGNSRYFEQSVREMNFRLEMWEQAEIDQNLDYYD